MLTPVSVSPTRSADWIGSHTYLSAPEPAAGARATHEPDGADTCLGIARPRRDWDRCLTDQRGVLLKTRVRLVGGRAAQDALASGTGRSTRPPVVVSLH
jgi:hypothetical protein